MSHWIDNKLLRLGFSYVSWRSCNTKRVPGECLSILIILIVAKEAFNCLHMWKRQRRNGVIYCLVKKINKILFVQSLSYNL